MRTPRFTRVSDGNPLRRLLVISKFDSFDSWIWFAIRPPGLRVAVESSRHMPRGNCRGARVTRDCSTTELGPDMVGATGVEPITDNPMSSAHQKCWRTATKRSGQESDCGIARCAEVTPPRNAPRGGIKPPLPGPDNPQSTARLKINLRPSMETGPARRRQKRNQLFVKTFPKGKIRVGEPARQRLKSEPR